MYHAIAYLKSELLFKEIPLPVSRTSIGSELLIYWTYVSLYLILFWRVYIYMNLLQVTYVLNWVFSFWYFGVFYA